jgi:hypothetical protein
MHAQSGGYVRSRTGLLCSISPKLACREARPPLPPGAPIPAAQSHSFLLLYGSRLVCVRRSSRLSQHDCGAFDHGLSESRAPPGIDRRHHVYQKSDDNNSFSRLTGRTHTAALNTSKNMPAHEAPNPLKARTVSKFRPFFGNAMCTIATA